MKSYFFTFVYAKMHLDMQKCLTFYKKVVLYTTIIYITFNINFVVISSLGVLVMLSIYNFANNKRKLLEHSVFSFLEKLRGINMKALISKKYLDSFDMKELSKAVFELFDDYNFICSLVKAHMIENSNNINNSKNKFNSSSEELKSVLKRESYVKYLNEFDRKIEDLKSSFTDDELKVFQYSIEDRETDKELCDRILKTYKTYFAIKKSCYVKVALKFNLLSETVDETLERTFMAIA